MNSIFIANLGKYDEGEMIGDWFELGQDEEYLQGFLEDVVGINEEYEEWFIADTDLSDFDMNIHEYEDIFSLNQMFIRYEQLDSFEKELVQAIVEVSSYSTSLEDAIDNMDNYTLFSDIETEFDIGYAMVNEWGIYDTSALGALANYIDYQSLGRDTILEGNGTLTSKGFLMEY